MERDCEARDGKGVRGGETRERRNEEESEWGARVEARKRGRKSRGAGLATGGSERAEGREREDSERGYLDGKVGADKRKTGLPIGTEFLSRLGEKTVGERNQILTQITFKNLQRKRERNMEKKKI